VLKYTDQAPNRTPAPIATATPVKIRRLRLIDFNEIGQTIALSNALPDA
jgi:hypothetical protein